MAFPDRILIVHARRARPGGADLALTDRVEMLTRAGHEVQVHAMAGGAERSAADALEESLASFGPDIVELQSGPGPGSTKALCAWAEARAVPVVQSLRDFHLACPQRHLFRDGRPCDDCVGKRPWPAVVHLCVGAGRAEAMAAARDSLTQRRLAIRHVARFTVASAAARERLIAAGLSAERVAVLPPSPDLPSLPETTRMGFVYAGALSLDKGIDVLADAMRYEHLEGEVRVIGDGPAGAEVESHPRLHRLGALSPASVREEMRRAVALVVPSRRQESGPRTVVEAFALGLPVIASRRGALAEYVDDGRTGLLFTPGSGADLAAKLRWAETHPDRMASMGLAARREYERRFAPAVVYPQLMAVYAQARADLPRR